MPPSPGDSSGGRKLPSPVDFLDRRHANFSRKLTHSKLKPHTFQLYFLEVVLAHQLAQLKIGTAKPTNDIVTALLNTFLRLPQFLQLPQLTELPEALQFPQLPQLPRGRSWGAPGVLPLSRALLWGCSWDAPALVLRLAVVPRSGLGLKSHGACFRLGVWLGWMLVWPQTCLCFQGLGLG
jgi:hypothetical protein